MKIKKVRERLGLSQCEMGRLMGMRQQAISRIEKGARGETTQHKAMLMALVVIHETGLIDELTNRWW